MSTSSSGRGVDVDSLHCSRKSGVTNVGDDGGGAGGRFGVVVTFGWSGGLFTAFFSVDFVVDLAPFLGLAPEVAPVLRGLALGGVGLSQKGRCALVEGCGDLCGVSAAAPRASFAGGVRCNVRPLKGSPTPPSGWAPGAIPGLVGVRGRPPLRGAP